MFDTGLYAHMKWEAPPDMSALSILEPLLTPILKAVPKAIVSQRVLAQALLNVFRAEKAFAKLTRPGTAEQIAGSIRVALAHLRRLKQVPRVWVQRSKGAAAAELQAYRRMASLFKSDFASEAGPTLADSSAPSHGGSLEENPADAQTPVRAEHVAGRFSGCDASSQPFKRARTLGRVPSAADSPMRACSDVAAERPRAARCSAQCGSDILALAFEKATECDAEDAAEAAADAAVVAAMEIAESLAPASEFGSGSNCSIVAELLDDAWVFKRTGFGARVEADAVRLKDAPSIAKQAASPKNGRPAKTAARAAAVAFAAETAATSATGRPAKTAARAAAVASAAKTAAASAARATKVAAAAAAAAALLAARPAKAAEAAKAAKTPKAAKKAKAAETAKAAKRAAPKYHLMH